MTRKEYAFIAVVTDLESTCTPDTSFLREMQSANIEMHPLPILVFYVPKTSSEVKAINDFAKNKSQVEKLFPYVKIYPAFMIDHDWNKLLSEPTSETCLEVSAPLH
jgi:hypothetical protein